LKAAAAAAAAAGGPTNAAMQQQQQQSVQLAEVQQQQQPAGKWDRVVAWVKQRSRSKPKTVLRQQQQEQSTAAAAAQAEPAYMTHTAEPQQLPLGPTQLQLWQQQQQHSSHTAAAPQPLSHTWQCSAGVQSKPGGPEQELAASADVQAIHQQQLQQQQQELVVPACPEGQLSYVQQPADAMEGRQQQQQQQRRADSFELEAAEAAFADFATINVEALQVGTD
jgi:hypothetical protein